MAAARGRRHPRHLRRHDSKSTSACSRHERRLRRGAPAGPRPCWSGSRGLSRRFGSVEAVRPLDLEIHAGDFFAILGPSGCGKTTLLRMIGGFIAPTTGAVEIDGADVTQLGPERRPANMVFQGFGLFPHMNVRQNVAYGLRIAKVDRAEIDERVGEIHPPRASRGAGRPRHQPALRRPAAARRARPRPHHAPQGAPPGRAARCPRSQAPAGDAAGAAPHSPRDRGHLRVRDARFRAKRSGSRTGSR